MPRSFFQSFFRVLTQISPLLATFGWNILVRKNPAEEQVRTGQNKKRKKKKRKGKDKPFGGEFGKSLERTSLTRKTPPSYGVPSS
jgi:hypothetical protein